MAGAVALLAVLGLRAEAVVVAVVARVQAAQQAPAEPGVWGLTGPLLMEVVLAAVVPVVQMLVLRPEVPEEAADSTVEAAVVLAAATAA